MDCIDWAKAREEFLILHNGKLIKVPEGTDEVVSIDDIEIPRNFRRTVTNPDKIKKAVRFYVEHGMLDKPITVIAETNEHKLHNKLWLIDEYSRAIAAHDWIGLKNVPVKYIDINDYDEYIKQCSENRSGK